MKTRVLEIDAIRLVAIICIIFAHFDSFTSLPFFKILDDYSASLGLNIFFFISGFLMYSSYKFTTYDDIISFFKRRVAKIYPLYWLSIIIVYIMTKAGFDIIYCNNISANKFLLLLHILGLQCLISENYSIYIWWFVSVVLLYYFLFSIILHYSKSIMSMLIYSFLIILPLMFLKNEFNLMHTNVFNYYIIFIAGILSAIAKNLKSVKKIIISYCAFLIISSIVSYLGFNTNYLDISKRDIVFLIFAFVFTLYKIKFSFTSKFKFSFLIGKLADSSYSVYLFHIPILTMFKLLVDLLIPLNITFYQYLNDSFMLFLGFPCALFSGYLINIYFNEFYKKLEFKIRLWRQFIDNS